jgi:opacity protein-like surface antigen
MFFAENYAFYLGLGINNLGGKVQQKGAPGYIFNDTVTKINDGQSVKLNLQFLDIPLGLYLQTEEMGYLAIFFRAGFNPMVNINASISSDDEANSLEKENFKENAPIFNFGYHLGAGVKYRLGGNTSAMAGIRWSSGLTDVTSNDIARLTTNAISINLGILF